MAKKTDTFRLRPKIRNKTVKDEVERGRKRNIIKRKKDKRETTRRRWMEAMYKGDRIK